MNVLIVGNGFDRKLGLKTDYISFLDWMKVQGFGVNDEIFSFSEAIRYKDELDFLNKIDALRYSSPDGSQSISFNFKIKQPYVSPISIPNENLTANKIIFTLPEILENKVKRKQGIRPNIWYCYIQLLRFEKKEKLLKVNTLGFEKFIGDNGNWVDLEGLIKANIYARIEEDFTDREKLAISAKFDVFSLANLLISKPDFYYDREFDEIVDIVWSDFLEFKSALCEYFQSLRNERISFFVFQSHCRKYIEEDENDTKFVINPTQYSPIINFNYTDYIFDSSNTKTYYVHGKMNDKEKVVFGLDEYTKDVPFIHEERKAKFESELRKNKKLLRFSKVSQLFELQIDKEPFKLEGLITTLSIVGHSIGEQDYAYYFSLFEKVHQGKKNIDVISIICLWYSFSDNKVIRRI